MLDFSNPLIFILTTTALFIVVVGRYLLIAGLFLWWLHGTRKTKWQKRSLGKKEVDKKQFFTELKWSIITSLIFAVIGSVTAILWQKGITKLYTDPHQFGLWYLPVSLIISMLIHETYYY